MAFDGVLITEIFHSLQGETSLAGVPFAFIRLTGCNLRCTYCDSAYAFKGGTRMSIPEVLATIRPYGVKHVLLTGGEPLLQRGTPELARTLFEAGYLVSVETHGEVAITPVRPWTRIVMDIKTPGSGMNRGGFTQNLPVLRTGDEIKFVITSPSDYEWACELVHSQDLPKVCDILFSPAVAAVGSPGEGRYPGVELKWLAERILEDRLPVRMQIQLHKLIWGAQTKGV